MCQVLNVCQSKTASIHASVIFCLLTSIFSHFYQSENGSNRTIVKFPYFCSEFGIVFTNFISGWLSNSHIVLVKVLGACNITIRTTKSQKKN